MAFKSEAQRQKFKDLLKQKKITQQVFDEYEDASKNLRLPEKVKVKKQEKPKRKPTGKSWL